MRGERRLDEGLRQREADLPQVFRVRAQHDDVVGGQPRRDDEPVEVVVLDLAAEDARERVLEHRVQRVDLDLGVGDRRLHAEVVHPDRLRVLRRDPVRPLVDHLEPHPLEHRQAVRQRDRAAAVEELEAQHARGRLERAIQRQRERIGRP